MADENIERLFVSLEARIKGYETGLNRAVAKMDATAKKIEDRSDRMGKNIEASANRAAARFNAALGKAGKAGKGLAADVGGGLTGRAGAIGGALADIGPGGYAAAAGIGAAALGLTVFYRQGKQALQIADDIGDAAQTLGLSAEALQEIRFAFNGLVDAETVDGAISKLRKTIGDATLGNKEAADTFKLLGVSIKDTDGTIRPTDEVLRSVADRIAALKSPAQQAAMATKLFGKEAGSKLLPILQQGSKAFDDAATRAKAMGAIIGNDAVAAAGDLQQQLDDLAVVVRAQLTEGFVQAGPQIVAFTRLMAENLPMAVETAAKVVTFLAGNLKTLGVVASGLTGARLGAFIGSFFPVIGTAFGALIGGAVGAGAAWLGLAGDTEAAADRVSGAIGTMGKAEKAHSDALQGMRDRYDELKVASDERRKSLEAEGKAAIDAATAGPIADAQAELAKRRAETDKARANQVPVLDMMGTATGFEEGIGQKAAEQAEAAQQAVVDALIKGRDEMAAALSGTEKIFDPINAGVDELIDHLGKLDATQISQTEAGFLSANKELQGLVATSVDARAEADSLEQSYVGLLKQLADASGWDTGSAQMATFITRASGVVQALTDINTPADEVDAAMKRLLEDFGVSVDAGHIVTEIVKIKNALDDMETKATTAFQTLVSKMGGTLARFLTGGGGVQVVPDHPSTPPGIRPTPPPPGTGSGGGVTLGGGGGGGAAKAKKDQESKLAAFLKDLSDETARLGMNSAAQKENELLVRAQAAAKEDFKNKVKDANGHLRESEALTIKETAAIKAYAAAQSAVPDILGFATDNLPKFALDQQLKYLDTLKGKLADPEIKAALEAQGLSAVDQAKAIDLQIQRVRDTASGTSEAVAAIGDALITGVQAAGTFADKLANIGLELAKLGAQGLFGQGPLGSIFNSLLGVASGGLGGLLNVASPAAVPQGVTNGTGFRRSSASGNRLRAGEPSIMNEVGAELAKRGQDLFIPGKPTTVMPASASRSAMAGGFGGGGTIKMDLTVHGSGDKELMANMAIGAQHIVQKSLGEYDRRLLGRIGEKQVRIG